jgi:hypothetical protein
MITDRAGVADATVTGTMLIWVPVGRRSSPM